MRRAILDTDIFSELLKRRDMNIVGRGMEYIDIFGQLTLTTLTVMEMSVGFESAAKPEHLKKFLHAVHQHELLTLNYESAVLAGAIYARLESKGQRIGIADTAIAAIAIDCGLELVTGNMKHYQRIIDLGYPLTLQNWRQAV